MSLGEIFSNVPLSLLMVVLLMGGCASRVERQRPPQEPVMDAMEIVGVDVEVQYRKNQYPGIEYADARRVEGEDSWLILIYEEEAGGCERNLRLLVHELFHVKQNTLSHPDDFDEESEEYFEEVKGVCE